MRYLLIFVLILFSLYTGWVIWEFGYTSVFEVTLREHPSTQVLLDLFVMGSLLMGVVLVDNYNRGRTLMQVLPYLFLMVVAGSIGALIYFIVHTDLLRPARKTTS